MSRGEIHVGDVGTVLQFQVLDENDSPVNLSSHTALSLIFNFPGGKLTVTPTFVTDGSDGLIQYATQAGDLSVTGPWTAEVAYTLSNGESKHSDTPAFQVFENLT